MEAEHPKHSSDARAASRILCKHVSRTEINKLNINLPLTIANRICAITHTESGIKEITVGNPPVGIQVFGILKSPAIFKHRKAECSQETQEQGGTGSTSKKTKQQKRNFIRLI